MAPLTVTNVTTRALTPAVREKLGIPRSTRPPYRWGFAAVVVGLACVPLALASLWTICGLFAAVGLVLLPAVHWVENRDARWREEVYRSGVESTGRVLDIEPAGSGRADHLVRLEFRAGGSVIRASVV